MIFEQELNGVQLLAPESFWKADPKLRAKVSNGCGPKRVGWIVPDMFLFCDFSPACDIHDWMYMEGGTKIDKEAADLVFLNNMLRIVGAKGGPLQWARGQRALTYYRAVRDFGDLAFWRGKEAMA